MKEGIKLGQYNTLRVVREVDFGLYLDGGADGDILMPKRYVPEGTEVGDDLLTFVYRDSEDRLLATTERPLATVGQFARLQVKNVNRIGAFMDWGVSKELLVPFREQRSRMEEGRAYVVYIYVDSLTNRIVGTEKINRHLDNLPFNKKVGDEVKAFVIERNELGYRVIIDNMHSAMIFRNQATGNPRVGESVRAYVAQIGDDKVSLSMRKIGYDRIDDIKRTLLHALQRNQGHLPLHDKSSAEVIKAELDMSKKDFKMGVGGLLREGLIDITNEGIKLK